MARLPGASVVQSVVAVYGAVGVTPLKVTVCVVEVFVNPICSGLLLPSMRCLSSSPSSLTLKSATITGEGVPPVIIVESVASPAVILRRSQSPRSAAVTSHWRQPPPSPLSADSSPHPPERRRACSCYLCKSSLFRPLNPAISRPERNPTPTPVRWSPLHRPRWTRSRCMSLRIVPT